MQAPSEIPDFILTPSPDDVIVKCGCGRSYTADSYIDLPLVKHNGGIQHVPCNPEDPEGEPAFDLELRNCPCRSTLSWRTRYLRGVVRNGETLLPDGGLV